MHFCVSAARVSLRGMAPAHLLTSGFLWPRKIGTNWFMPALVKSRFGESGSRLEDGTMVCCFDLKKSRNDWRICDDVIMATIGWTAYPSQTSPTPEKSGEKHSPRMWDEARWKLRQHYRNNLRHPMGAEATLRECLHRKC